MARPERITPKVMDKIQADVRKIEKLQEQIRKAEEGIQEIQRKHSYLCYLGEAATEGLTIDQSITLNDLNNKILYALK